MVLKPLGLISPRWIVTTATKGDTLLGIVGLQGTKKTGIGRTQEVCQWRHKKCDGLGDYDLSDQAEEGPIWLALLQVLTL
ncbi:hypothetical protein Tco_0192998, partial [Tanacetum coccineum]